METSVEDSSQTILSTVRIFSMEMEKLSLQHDGNSGCKFCHFFCTENYFEFLSSHVLLVINKIILIYYVQC